MPVRLPIGLLFLAILEARAAAGELVVYSPHGPEIRDEFTAAFETARPGTKVRWMDMGAATILDRIRTERDAPVAEVWWGAPTTMFTLAGREGLLAPYRPDWAEVVPEYARGEGDLWFGQFDLPIGIGLVRGSLPAASIPDRWDDLLESAGRILIRDPPASGTMKTFLAAMVLRQPSEEKGFDWLRRLHERTEAYAPDPASLFRSLVRGEGDLTVWNVTDLLFQRNRYGYPFEVILPEGGVPVITDGIGLVAGAGAEARAFYDFVTTREANLLLAREHFRLPTRQDLPAEEMPAWARELRYRPLEVSRERLVAALEPVTARWEREIRSAPGPWPTYAAVLAVLLTGALFAASRLRRRSGEGG